MAYKTQCDMLSNVHVRELINVCMYLSEALKLEKVNTSCRVLIMTCIVQTLLLMFNINS